MNDRKPIIGITSDFDPKAQANWVCLNQNYMNAIRQAGGIPVILPVDGTEEELSTLLDVCSGVIFSGGEDVEPALYGEEKLNDSVKPSALRDAGDMRICRLVQGRKIPVLGICRGTQVLNVFFGGTLYQDIPVQVQTKEKHRMEPPYRRTSHRCLLEPGSPLRELLGTEQIMVNSHHHQSVKDVAPGFAVMARCDDGVIEGIYKPGDRFFWGVQWHPEKIWDIDENSARIFEAFLKACKNG